jgi:hypothetical protein
MRLAHCAKNGPETTDNAKESGGQGRKIGEIARH